MRNKKINFIFVVHILLMIEKEIQNALETLKSGGLLLYPTDTVWGVGCDATNAQAVEKIYHLKKRAESKALICLVNNFKMLKTYVKEVPKQIPAVLAKSKKPTTVIYNAPKGLAKNMIAQDNTLAIRICRDEFCQELIKIFGKPIVSTSANISGENTPKNFTQIHQDIIKGVDYIVNSRRENAVNSAPSTIIKLKKDGHIEMIRE